MFSPQNLNNEDPLLIEDLAFIEKKLQEGVRSQLPLPKELAERLSSAGGKRIRPLLMCLSYRSFHKSPSLDRASVEDLHTLAAVAEWVHTATLFHDDVLDNSPMRRNIPSAHILYGNKVAILVGDFVYAEAFSLLMDRGLLVPSRELARTIKNLVEGELLQHEIATSRNLDLNDYIRIANAKTAALFAWCTETGAWVAGTDKTPIAREFGSSLGLAFQMADDLLDTYTLKPFQAALKERLEWIESAPPLPIVMAQKEAFPIWKRQSPDAENIAELQKICRQKEVIDSCVQLLQKSLKKASLQLEDLGHHPILSSALNLIEARALEGIQAADSQRVEL